MLIAALAVLYGGWITYVVILDKPLDFYVYYLASRSFAKGINAYEISDPAWDALAVESGITNYTRPYRYPPLTALLVAPLTLLGPRGAAIVWLAVNALAMVGGMWCLASSSVWPQARCLGLALLLFFVPPLTTLHAGQANGLLFFATALAFYAFAKRSDYLCGAALAFGTLLKVVPIALIAYLFWRRQIRSFLFAIIAIVFLLALSWPLVGTEGLISYIGKGLMLSNPNLVFTEATNQSLVGFFGRLMSQHPSGEGTSLALILGRVSSLFLVILTSLVCWPRGRIENLFRQEAALVVIAVHLIAPFVYYHQLVMLLIPLVVVVETALQKPRQWLIVAIITLGYVATDLHGLLWKRLACCSLLQSFPLYLALALWVVLAWFVIQEKRCEHS